MLTKRLRHLTTLRVNACGVKSRYQTIDAGAVLNVATNTKDVNSLRVKADAKVSPYKCLCVSLQRLVKHKNRVYKGFSAASSSPFMGESSY